VHRRATTGTDTQLVTFARLGTLVPTPSTLMDTFSVRQVPTLPNKVNLTAHPARPAHTVQALG